MPKAKCLWPSSPMEKDVSILNALQAIERSRSHVLRGQEELRELRRGSPSIDLPNLMATLCDAEHCLDEAENILAVNASARERVMTLPPLPDRHRPGCARKD